MFGLFTVRDSLLAIADEYPGYHLRPPRLLDRPQTPNVVACASPTSRARSWSVRRQRSKSTTGKVGYIGANSLPFIESFRAGFEQGVGGRRSERRGGVRPHLPRTLAGDADFGYADVEQARQAATAMYNDGVDVIYVAAGGSGLGVIEAATELSGPIVSSGRSASTPTSSSTRRAAAAHLLTSMFKRIDRGVEAVVAAHVDGTLAVPERDQR